MALFATSDAVIRARLRLSSVPDSSEDTLAIIAEGIAEARLRFYRRLGRPAVQALVNIAEVAEPSTDDEVMRTLATHTEVKAVRVFLLRELPNAFMDASGDLNRRWNEEAPFRERPRSDREREIARLEEEIEQAMQELERDGDESPGDTRSVLTFDGTPDNPEEIPLPGDTILPRPRRTLAQD
jgi:hypothetical protein